MSTGGWIWYELLSTDVVAARKFYADVVGWTWSPVDPATGYAMFLAGDVANVDTVVAAAVRDGATQRVPSMDIPNVGRFALIADPQGAEFGVSGPRR